LLPYLVLGGFAGPDGKRINILSMKMRFVAALMGLAIGFAGPILAQRKDTVDPQITQQIRLLAMKYDAAFNRSDAAVVAALYTEDAIYAAQDGTFHGRQAIEKAYSNYFQHWHSIKQVSTVDRIIAVGTDIRAFGTWTSAFQDTNGAPKKDRGHYRWLVVREGDTWKIRTNTNRSSNLNATN
jgi:uncharacterized protein (TIGR02246 family)